MSDIDVEGESDADDHVQHFRQECMLNVSSKRRIPAARKRRKRKLQLGQYKYKSLRRLYERRRKKVAFSTKQEESSLPANISAATTHHLNFHIAPKETHKLQARNVALEDSSTDSCCEYLHPSTCHKYSQTISAGIDKAVQCNLRSEAYNFEGSKCSSDIGQHTDGNQYLQTCIATLFSQEYLRNVLMNFQEHNLLQHFMSFITSIENGTLSPLNIAVLLCLERSILQTLRSTTDMRYSIHSKQFWELIYRVGGGQLIRLMSGCKHFNQINERKVCKNKYTVSTGDFNFAVPDERILSQSISQLPREIRPGIILEFFPFINQTQEYILSVDGKKCAQGLLDYGYGDIDLMHFEEPSLYKRKCGLDSEMQFIDEMETISLDDRRHLLRQARLLPKLVHMLSDRLRCVRQAIVRHELQRNSMLKTMARKNEPLSKYAQGFSVVDAFIRRARENISSLLNCNKRICQIMANLNETRHLFPSEDMCDLTIQRNCHILPNPENIQDDEFLSNNIHFVKQRSNLWHTVRSQGRLTASTMYNALGLRDLPKQRSHFRQYVLKHAPKKFKPDEQAAIDFGSRHEVKRITITKYIDHFLILNTFTIIQSTLPIVHSLNYSFQVHSISTLCTIFASAFLPECFHYFEVGSKYLDGELIKNLMVVSPDGIFKCSRKSDSTHVCKSIFNLPFHQELIVEVKSIFSAIQNKTLTPVLYEPRKCHIPQTAAQMAAWNTNAGIYVTAGLESMTVMYLEKDNELWDTLWHIAREFYDSEDVDLPDYMSDLNAACQAKLQHYIESKTQFFCELPLIKSVHPTDEMDRMDSDIDTHFYPYKSCSATVTSRIQRDWQVAIEHWLEVLQDSRAAIKEAFQLERRKATELLMFVISNSDRISSKDCPLAIPVAYCLKGKSMSQKCMRTLLDYVFLHLYDEKTRILCTAMDGQWAGVVNRDRNDKPLTEFELQRDVWKQFNDMKKSDLIAFMNDSTMPMIADKAELSQFHTDTVALFQHGNLSVSVDLTPQENGQLHKTINARCNGGEYGLTNFISNCRLASFNDRPDLFRTQTVTVNLLELITEHARNLSMNVLATDDCMCALDTTGQSFTSSKHILLHTNVGLLVMQDILIGILSHKRFTTWQYTTLSQLYEKHMRNGQVIYNSFTVAEMEIILQQLLKYHADKTHLRLLKVKVEKANYIARILGKEHKHIPHFRSRNVSSLRNLSLRCVKAHIPELLLKECMSRLSYAKQHEEWLRAQPIPNYTDIPFPPNVFHYFSFPGKSEDDTSLQPMTIDPTHILTNLRLHCTTKSVFYCDPKAFIRVCETDKDALSLPIISQVLDKQNCAIAQSVFSERVQEIMEQNGDTREAELVKHIRLWFDACNKRSVPVMKRIQDLTAMDKYCRRFWNPHKFPAPGMYVCGLPSSTFQAILQSISCRLQLYKLSANHTFNHRSVSTLPLESIFSDVSILAKQTNGCPLASEIPKLIAKMLHINATKHDPDKCFSVRLAKKSNYPCMIGSARQDFLILHYDKDTFFQPHDFDFPDVKSRKKKVRRTQLSACDAPQRGTLPVRVHFKIDESKVDALLRV